MRYVILGAGGVAVPSAGASSNTATRSFSSRVVPIWRRSAAEGSSCAIPTVASCSASLRPRARQLPASDVTTSQFFLRRPSTANSCSSSSAACAPRSTPVVCAQTVGERTPSLDISQRAGDVRFHARDPSRAGCGRDTDLSAQRTSRCRAISLRHRRGERKRGCRPEREHFRLDLRSQCDGSQVPEATFESWNPDRGGMWHWFGGPSCGRAVEPCSGRGFEVLRSCRDRGGR